MNLWRLLSAWLHSLFLVLQLQDVLANDRPLAIINTCYFTQISLHFYIFGRLSRHQVQRKMCLSAIS